MTEKVADGNNTFAEDVEEARQRAEEFGFKWFVRELMWHGSNEKSGGKKEKYIREALTIGYLMFYSAPLHGSPFWEPCPELMQPACQEQLRQDIPVIP